MDVPNACEARQDQPVVEPAEQPDQLFAGLWGMERIERHRLRGQWRSVQPHAYLVPRAAERNSCLPGRDGAIMSTAILNVDERPQSSPYANATGYPTTCGCGR